MHCGHAYQLSSPEYSRSSHCVRRLRTACRARKGSKESKTDSELERVRRSPSWCCSTPRAWSCSFASLLHTTDLGPQGSYTARHRLTSSRLRAAVGRRRDQPVKRRAFRRARRAAVSRSRSGSRARVNKGSRRAHASIGRGCRELERSVEGASCSAKAVVALVRGTKRAKEVSRLVELEQAARRGRRLCRVMIDGRRQTTLTDRRLDALKRRASKAGEDLDAGGWARYKAARRQSSDPSTRLNLRLTLPSEAWQAIH